MLINKELFTETKPIYSIAGWQLAAARRDLELDDSGESVTQAKFAEVAGWSQQYQDQMENFPYMVFVSEEKRNEILATFCRLLLGKFHLSLEIERIDAKLFCEHKRYKVNAEQLRKEIIERCMLQQFAAFCGWNASYLRRLTGPQESIVSEDVAKRITSTLASMNDPEQIVDDRH